GHPGAVPRRTDLGAGGRAVHPRSHAGDRGVLRGVEHRAAADGGGDYGVCEAVQGDQAQVTRSREANPHGTVCLRFVNNQLHTPFLWSNGCVRTVTSSGPSPSARTTSASSTTLPRYTRNRLN